MPTPTQFPNLERYLKSAQVADAVRKIKRPEEWAKWIGIAVIVASTVLHSWAVLVVSFVACMALQGFFEMRRYGAKSMSDFMSLGLRQKLQERLPKIVQDQLTSGVLVSNIGERATELLDACGKHALATITASVELHMMGPKLPQIYTVTRRAAGEAADAAFRRALATVRPSLMHHQPPDADQITELEQIEKGMAELAAETQAALTKADHERRRPHVVRTHHRAPKSHPRIRRGC